MVGAQHKRHVLDVLQTVIFIHHHAWVVNLLRMAQVLIIHVVDVLGVRHPPMKLMLGINRGPCEGVFKDLSRLRIDLLDLLSVLVFHEHLHHCVTPCPLVPVRKHLFGHEVVLSKAFLGETVPLVHPPTCHLSRLKLRQGDQVVGVVAIAWWHLHHGLGASMASILLGGLTPFDAELDELRVSGKLLLY